MQRKTITKATCVTAVTLNVITGLIVSHIKTDHSYKYCFLNYFWGEQHQIEIIKKEYSEEGYVAYPIKNGYARIPVNHNLEDIEYMGNDYLNGIGLN